VVPIPGTCRGAYFEENSLAANLALTAEQVAAPERITAAADREHDTAVAARNWFNGVTPTR